MPTFKKYAALLVTSSTKIIYRLSFLGLKRSKWNIWNIMSAIPSKYSVKSAHNTFQRSISAEVVFTVPDWLSVSHMPSKTSQGFRGLTLGGEYGQCDNECQDGLSTKHRASLHVYKRCVRKQLTGGSFSFCLRRRY